MLECDSLCPLTTRGRSMAHGGIRQVKQTDRH